MARTDPKRDPIADQAELLDQLSLLPPEVIEVALSAFVDGSAGRTRWEVVIHDGQGAARHQVGLLVTWQSFGHHASEFLREFTEAVINAESRVSPF